jgi:hypothetical protein
MLSDNMLSVYTLLSADNMTLLDNMLTDNMFSDIMLYFFLENLTHSPWRLWLHEGTPNAGKRLMLNSVRKN